MILNGKEVGESKVNAFYIIRKHSSDTYIEIISKDNKRFRVTFNDEEFNPLNLEINNKINIIKHLYWDVELITNETYYLFDLSKDKVFLTRLGDNLYNIEIDIKDPDMIYCPLGKNNDFNSLYINVNFSFVYKDNIH